MVQAPCASEASVVVQVVDMCDTCDANRVVVPYTVFTQNLAAGNVGQVAMQYRQVGGLY